jgi:hypothetical protein
MTPEQAKELVEQIAQEYGWIPPEDRAHSTEITLQVLDRLQAAVGPSARKWVACFLTLLDYRAQKNLLTRYQTRNSSLSKPCAIHIRACPKCRGQFVH